MPTGFKCLAMSTSARGVGMQIGTLVIAPKWGMIGIVKELDTTDWDDLDVHIYWIETSRTSWENSNQLEVLCK